LAVLSRSAAGEGEHAPLKRDPDVQAIAREKYRLRISVIENGNRTVVLRLCCGDCPGLIRKARYSKGLRNTGRNTGFPKKNEGELQETLCLQA
jgi:hypothetical protein